MYYKKEFTLSVSCFLLALLCSILWFSGNDENLAARISPQILRLHVIANSNSAKDQAIKLQIRDLLLDELDDIQLSQTSSGSESSSAKELLCQYIRENQPYLEEKANTWLASLHLPYQVHLQLAKCYFPAKAYGDLTLPRGFYDAVQVSIGNARGRNWWCVVYPQLCFLDITHAVIPDSSRDELLMLLGEQDYRALLDSRSLDLQIRFRFLELLQSGFQSLIQSDHSI